MSLPAYGTAPIRCGKTKCKFRGYETDLAKRLLPDRTTSICPLCGCDSYMFMTEREISAWRRSLAPISPKEETNG